MKRSAEPDVSAINHAAKTGSDEERATALEIARNITRAAGIPHAGLIGREAA